MTVNEILISIAVGVLATLIASGLIWFFRRQLRQAIAALDMSAGAIFAWVMAFIMLAVIIVFPLIGTEIPGTLTGIFAFTVGVLLAATVFSRRGK